MTKMECQIVKCKADCNKNWASWLNMQAVLQLFSKPSKILPARGLRGNKKEQNVYVFMKKWFQGVWD